MKTVLCLVCLALSVRGYKFKEGDEIHAKGPIEAFPKCLGKCQGQRGPKANCRCTIERGANLKISKIAYKKDKLSSVTLKDTSTGKTYLCNDKKKKGTKVLARPCIGNGASQFPGTFKHEACRAEEHTGPIWIFGYGSDCWKGTQAANTSKNLGDKPAPKYFAYVEDLKRMWWWREATYRGDKEHHSYIPILADAGKVAELEKYWAGQGPQYKTDPANVDAEAERPRTFGCIWQVDGGKVWPNTHEGMQQRDAFLVEMDKENPGYRRRTTKAYPFRAPQESMTIDVYQDGETAAQTFSFRPPKPEITVVTYEYNFGARSIHEYANSRDNKDAKEACDVGKPGYLEPWSHKAEDRQHLEEAAEAIGDDETTKGVSEHNGKKFPGDRSNLAYFARTYRVLEAIGGVDGMTAELAKQHELKENLGKQEKVFKSTNSVLIRGVLDRDTIDELTRMRLSQEKL